MNSSFVCYFFFALALFIACGTNVVSAKTIPQSSGEIDETGLEESSAVDSIVGNGLERAKIIDNINSMFNVDKSTSKAVAKLKKYARREFFQQLEFCANLLEMCAGELLPTSCRKEIMSEFGDSKCSPSMMKHNVQRKTIKKLLALKRHF